MLVLEHVFQPDEERMRQLVEDVSFVENTFKLVLIKDLVFAHDFHGVKLLCVFVLDKKYFADIAFAQNSLEFKVV